MPTIVHSRLTAVLHQIMEDRGMTSRREMGRAAGVSQGTIENIMHGRIPKATTLVTMERELGLRRSELLIAAGYVSEPTELRPKVQKVLSIIESLTPDKLEDALRYAVYLLQQQREEKTRRH